jgi:hypothetical protein
MPVQTQEARIILAIEAIRTAKRMSIRRAAKTYDVPKSTLRHRMKGRVAKAEIRNGRHQLTQSEEETIVSYVLDLDSRGFPPRIEGVKDMANLLLSTRHAKPVGTRWANRFIRRRPELKTRFSRAYDFQHNYNPQAVLSKLDVKLRTPTPTGPLLPEADPWVSQTPHGPAEAVS